MKQGITHEDKKEQKTSGYFQVKYANFVEKARNHMKAGLQKWREIQFRISSEAIDFEKTRIHVGHCQVRLQCNGETTLPW